MANPSCIKCQQELPGAVLFCPYCGTRQRPAEPGTQPQTTPETVSYIGTTEAATNLSIATSPTLQATDTTPTIPTPPITMEQGILQPGSILAEKYEIQEVIGEGGMGVVYKATDSIVERDVAIKMLHANLLGDAGIRRRFLREARLMSGWSHPHVVQVYDLIEQNRMLAIVMEFIDGITLTEYLKQWGGKLPFDEINLLFSDLLSTMEEAHNQGIVHRDLKPDNILLHKTESRMFPKIVDFGLAKILEGTTYTVSGALLGTCQYMPPEQIQNDRSVDHRADIYSLGITLYQLCTGRCPFQDTNHFALMMAHVNNTPPPPSSIRNDLPPACEALLLQTLAKNPEERPDDCGIFRQQLQQALGGAPLQKPRTAANLDPEIRRKDGHVLLLIPEGHFLSGPNRRNVYLDAYYIDQAPVTNRQFYTFLKVTGYKPSDTSAKRFLSHWGGTKYPKDIADHPVVFVSWHDARAYAAWAGLHLPTEAQWEKSARGEKGRKYPWGREDPTPERAHFGRKQPNTVAVRSHPDGISPYGVHDLAGNVWEWCEDVDQPSFYSSGPTHNPRNVMRNEKAKYVLRGGSWMYGPRSLKTTTRTSYEPHFRLDDVGFRCVHIPT
jgi:serine/threonine-protein kinase